MRLPEKQGPLLRIPAPVRRGVGLGDALKQATRAIGFKPCGGCQKRATTLNGWIQFTPFRHPDH